MSDPKAQAVVSNGPSRATGVEHEEAVFACLLITFRRLRSALDRKEAIGAIADTLETLVGSDEFAIYGLNADGDELELIAAFGGLPPSIATIPCSDGVVGSCIARGELMVPAAAADCPVLPGGKTLRALVPLTLGGLPFGAIAVFRLLEQKDGVFDEMDLDLFNLLKTEAAMALNATRRREARVETS